MTFYKDRIRDVAEGLGKRVQDQLQGQGIVLDLTDAARDLLTAKGYDPTLGARPLRRAIQRLVEDPLSEKILYKTYNAGELIVVDVEDDPDKPGDQRIVFRAIEGVRAPSTAELAGAGTGEGGSDSNSGE